VVITVGVPGPVPHGRITVCPATAEPPDVVTGLAAQDRGALAPVPSWPVPGWAPAIPVVPAAAGACGMADQTAYPVPSTVTAISPAAVQFDGCRTSFIRLLLHHVNVFPRMRPGW
jgi:hypothetical protein